MLRGVVLRYVVLYEDVWFVAVLVSQWVGFCGRQVHGGHQALEVLCAGGRGVKGATVWGGVWVDCGLG